MACSTLTAGSSGSSPGAELVDTRSKAATGTVDLSLYLLESWRVNSPPLAAFPRKANVSEPYGAGGHSIPRPLGRGNSFTWWPAASR